MTDQKLMRLAGEAEKYKGARLVLVVDGLYVEGALVPAGDWSGRSISYLGEGDAALDARELGLGDIERDLDDAENLISPYIYLDDSKLGGDVHLCEAIRIRVEQVSAWAVQDSGPPTIA